MRGALVGVSGPDGAGKSSVVQAVLRRAGPDRARAVYLYGCVVCRRARPRGVPAGAADAPRGHRLRRLHGLVDAIELLVRLRVAERRAEGAEVLVTDRSPLDGLAKHRPAAGSLAARAYDRAIRRYDLIVLLDADPSTLADRDGEHSADELAAWRNRFAEQAHPLDRVFAIRADVADADAIARWILGAVERSGVLATNGNGRRQP